MHKFTSSSEFNDYLKFLLEKPIEAHSTITLGELLEELALNMKEAGIFEDITFYYEGMLLRFISSEV